MVDAGMPAWMAVIVPLRCARWLVCWLRSWLTARCARPGHVRLDYRTGHEHLFGKPGHGAVWRQAAQRAGYFQPATITVGGVSLPLNVLLTIGIGVAMMLCMQLFVKKTKLGKAMRAVPQDKDASTVVGINVNKIIT